MKSKMKKLGSLFIMVLILLGLFATIIPTKIFADLDETEVVTVPDITISGLKATSSTYNSIKLIWNKVASATGYEVWRSTDNKKFNKLITTKPGDTLTYTDKSLITGKVYYYKVKATGITGAPLSNVVSTKPVPKKVILAVKSAGYNSTKVSWGKVGGASGYQIYRATSLTETYKLVKTTTAITYTNGNLTTGKTYYYKVRAYRIVSGKKIYGPYSDIISAKPIPAKPTLTLTKESTTSIKSSWKKITGATGYEIYMSTDGVAYVNIKTVKKGTTVSYTKTGLSKGQIYYFKVRAYRTVNGKKVYSSYSAVKNTDVQATWGEYGQSFKEQALEYYKIGTGKNILFIVAEQHGWEGKWAGDGIELTKIANSLITYLQKYKNISIFEKWTVYILPKANPDGITYGKTAKGVGRATYEGYDMNRIYATSNFKIYKDAEHFTGKTPFLAQEARAIRDLTLQVKSQTKSKIVLIDLHGWLNQTIGDPQIGKFYNKQFSNSNQHSWGTGYLVTWAKEKLGAKASLVELPEPKNAQDVIKRDFSGKFIKGTINLLNEYI